MFSSPVRALRGDTSTRRRRRRRPWTAARGRDPRARLVLPVQPDDRARELAPALAEPGLRAVVMLGLAGGRARVALERVGLNVMDYGSRQSRRRGPRRALCRRLSAPTGAAAVPAILGALNAEGIPAYLSNTAELPLQLHALHGAARPRRRGPAHPAGFIPCPTCRAWLPPRLDEPSMDLALMVTRRKSRRRWRSPPEGGAPRLELSRSGSRADRHLADPCAQLIVG